MLAESAVSKLSRTPMARARFVSSKVFLSRWTRFVRAVTRMLHRILGRSYKSGWGWVEYDYWRFVGCTVHAISSCSAEVDLGMPECLFGRWFVCKDARMVDFAMWASEFW